MRTCCGSHHRGVLLRVALLDVPVVEVVVMIFRKDNGNTHLGGGRVAVGVLHVVVILRSCGTSYASCSRCPRALQLRVRLVALRVAVEHIHIKDKLGQRYDNIMTNWAKIMTLIFNLGQRVHKLVAAHIHLGT